MADDLVAFLRARLDEEAEVADRENRLSGTWWDNKAGEADSMLVGMFSPARVLREVEAKRQIIELHDSVDQLEGECGTCDALWPCQTLLLLALPHADHDQYRPEWAPDR